MKRQPNGFMMMGLMTFIFLVLMVGIIYFGQPPHIPLFICTILLVVFVLWFGATWETIEKGMVAGIAKGLKPVIILLLIGILIGVWMANGTVPLLVSLGFKLISPEWFLVTALLATMVVSSFTGSSFTTIGTVGAALMGIGLGFGIDPALCAGAIISGAMFGDKMSPLSDTTNFAPAVAGVDLFHHIRHMIWTTVPAMLTAFLFFLFIGKGSPSIDRARVDSVLEVISQTFNLNWLVMISPIIVVILAYRKWPIVPVLVIGIVTGGLTYLFLQPGATLEMLMSVMQNGMELNSDNEAVNAIVNRGGLMSMMFSVSIILIALAFGGVAYETGLILQLVEGLTHRLERKGHYVTSTIFASIGVNLITGEQYLSILLPGQTFKSVYDKKKIPRKTLSRSLEDGGTLVNPLVPWSVCGAFFSSTLGVSVVEYLPYVLFLWLCPVLSILLAYLPKVNHWTLNERPSTMNIN